MTINAQAWKMTMEKGTSHCVYRMQVNGVNNKNQKKIFGALKGWNEAGYGYNSKTGKEFLFFSRDFGTTEKWLEWAKSFNSWKLDELDKNGEIKSYVKIGLRPGQTPLIAEAPAQIKGVRKCSKCGEPGHNARTCRTAYRKAEVKIQKVEQRKKRVEKGPRKCSACGESGHNARTCKAK